MLTVFQVILFNQHGLFKQAWIYSEATKIQFAYKINK